eukprot:214945_1
MSGHGGVVGPEVLARRGSDDSEQLLRKHQPSNGVSNFLSLFGSTNSMAPPLHPLTPLNRAFSMSPPMGMQAMATGSGREAYRGDHARAPESRGSLMAFSESHRG